MKITYLHSGWALSGGKIGTLPAEVPGCVHTDLMANGVIHDIYYRDNNTHAQWIEDEDWVYTCHFDAEIGKQATLVFEGLDTYATILLNGRKIGETDDMFIPYEFDVSSLLRETDNELLVRFSSPTRQVKGLPLCQGAFTKERIRTRRIQCTYGWDWVDRFVTCGIFGPVFLRYEENMYVKNTYIYTDSIDAFGAQLACQINFENYEEGSLIDVQVLSPEGTCEASCQAYVSEKTFYRRFDIREPQLWYPNGYGKQPLYTLKIVCGDNVYTENFGIRTLKVVQLADEEGSEYFNKAKKLQQGVAGTFDHNTSYSGFQLVVNGLPIFCKGGNWVPCEPFPSAANKDKYEDLIVKAKNIGINTLRVWGGGLFEKKEFYDLCDREGILVIQDFLMACGTYPDSEEWFLDRLRREATFAVTYLRNHPCLAFWQGDNENATLGADTQKTFKGRAASIRALQPVIASMDPQRAYMISSPYGGDFYASITCGTTHSTNYLLTTFDYFNQTDCKNYKEFFTDFTARFINEEPLFGAAELCTLRKFLKDSDIFDDKSEEMLRFHSKSNPDLADDMYDTVKAFAFKALGDPTDDDDRQFKYRYLQYEWMRVVFENARRNLGYCNGLLFWMYNDCWPAALGWSIVDYYGTPKAGYYCFKRMSKALVGSVTEDGDHYRLTVSNDGNETKDFAVTAYRLSMSEGNVVKDTYNNEGSLDGYSVTELTLPWKPDDNTLVVCDLSYDKESDRCFCKRDNLPIRRCEGVTVVSQNESEIVLKADAYVHVIAIECEGVLSDNYFSMLPGEFKTIHIPQGERIISMTTYTL